jgi:hypothetical protein
VAVTWPSCKEVKYLEFPPFLYALKLQIVQPVKSVQSSKFCLGRLLKIRNLVHEIARNYFHLSHSSQTYTQGTPNLQNGIPDKNRVESQHLDQESEVSQKLRNKYQKCKLAMLNYKDKLWTSMEGANEELRNMHYGWNVEMRTCRCRATPC